MPNLQRQLGQSGWEAGRLGIPSTQKLYIGTSKSYNINQYLRTDGKTMHTSQSNWDSLGYTTRMVKNDIAKIDSGMKPLHSDTMSFRFDRGDVIDVECTLACVAFSEEKRWNYPKASSENRTQGISFISLLRPAGTVTL